ncbi:hypothetical protein C0J52_02726 [Blattella germanica]|nr:hypothetical protein C0J52_02726 [Blattella germanica]
MEHEDMIRQWLNELTDVSEIDIPQDEDSDDSDVEQPNNSDHDSNNELSGVEVDPDSRVYISPQYVGDLDGVDGREEVDGVDGREEVDGIAMFSIAWSGALGGRMATPYLPFSVRYWCSVATLQKTSFAKNRKFLRSLGMELIKKHMTGRVASSTISPELKLKIWNHLGLETSYSPVSVSTEERVEYRKIHRRRTVLTEEKLDDIAYLLENSPNKSLSKLAQQAGVSVSSVYKATKLLNFKPYKFVFSAPVMVPLGMQTRLVQVSLSTDRWITINNDIDLLNVLIAEELTIEPRAQDDDDDDDDDDDAFPPHTSVTGAYYTLM